MWTKQLDGVCTLSPASPKGRLHLFEILAIPVALLSLGDAFLTQYMVGAGQAVEGNPLMARLLIDNQFLGFKVIGTVACLVLLWRVSKRLPYLAGLVAFFMMIFYSGVLVWNSNILSAL
jgi:hypothetical protein